MVATNERLLIGLKLLDRLKTGLRESWQANGLLASLNNQARATAVNAEKNDAIQEELIWPPTLQAMLEQADELTPFSMILGVCDDCLPFVLDLKNPSPGAILVSGEHGSGKTRLLASMLHSAAYLSEPDQVKLYVASPAPGEFSTLAQIEHCQEVINTQGSAYESLILELADLAETRQRNTPQPPVILVAIDDLQSNLHALSEQAFARLCWLVRHGPRAWIWIIAATAPEHAKDIHPRLLAAFRTRLVGPLHDRSLTGLLSGDHGLDTRGLEHGYQFCVPYGEDWLPFWICDPVPENEISESFTE